MPENPEPAPQDDFSCEMNFFGSTRGYKSHVKFVGPARKMQSMAKLFLDYATVLEFEPEKATVRGSNGQQETPLCEECSGSTTYKSGEKNGKAWSGYFCENEECGHVMWTSAKKVKK